MEHPQPWLRRNAVGLLGVLLVLPSTVWLLIGLGHRWEHPMIGWLPLPVGAALATYVCWRTARAGELDAGTRRFWRHFTLAAALYTAAIVGNLVDATAGATPSQHIGVVTLGLYLGVLGVVIWALLRLPSWQRTRSDWIRFGLDACVVLVATGTFAWHFSFSNHERWVAQIGSSGGILAIVVVGLVSVVTFVKVAFAGAGRLDRGSLRILAVGSAASTVVGAMTPFLGDFPYLSTSLVAVPVATVTFQLAAAQQLRGGSRPPRPRPVPRISVVPYVAVAAMAALLLETDNADRTESTVVKAGAVVLTFLVMARQIVALRENRGLLGVVDANLSELRQYQEQLTHQANHDHLTGVANRTLFETHVGELLAAGTPFHIALLDMDDFKTVNDQYGHHTGDALLMIVSDGLAEAVGDAGMVVRLGGDEFVLVLPDTEHAGVEPILAEVQRILRRPQHVKGAPTNSAASIGVTSVQDGDSPEELLRRADVAMYAAKSLGGDRWQRFDPAMDETARETARLSADLIQAFERDEFFLVYQPIVELPTHGLAGVEALLRWRHPERGLVPPDIFIPLAERNGLIVQLGRWVLENACRQAADWQHRFGAAAPAKVSINVSARQLAEHDFVTVVEQVITSTGVDRSRLVLEVTETAVLGAGAALDAVRSLRDNGLRVALDDFGTGQSSLSLLLNCPVDVLKVDKSFVSGSAADHAGAVIVQNLIGFTDGLRIEAIAEGVETPEQAQRLYDAGYRLAQGYLFGRPVPAADIESQLATAAGVPASVR
jgi:diguanylate cyclase (GGDEF)-like protein